MGTRALIKFMNEFKKPICILYSQYDGYPKSLSAMVQWKMA